MANRGWYTFMVEKGVDKNKARKIIEEVFGVKVEKIKSATVKGEGRRSLKTRKLIKSGPIKKIMVKLAGDQKIDLFEVGGK